MSKVIEVQNLSKTFPLPRKEWRDGKRVNEAVKGISFAVEKGAIFGILGPNGAGKTTTLDIIEGLKEQTEGKVTVLGFDNIKNVQEIKKRIGVQLQTSQYLHHLSLGELLNLFKSFYPHIPSQPPLILRGGEPPLNIRGGQGVIYDRKGLLKLVGLSDKEHKEFTSLSGGQKQRFTIATSLVHSPDILFLDEPTTGLDPAARRSMWQLIKELNRQGITIVLTTHYMEEAEFLCHRVAIMDQGKILEIDEPKKLIDRLSETTQISFFTGAKIGQELFAEFPEVKKIYASYPQVVLEISSLEKIANIVYLLKKRNIVFYGFTVKTATLEDVYLKLTGKAYEDV